MKSFKFISLIIGLFLVMPAVSHAQALSKEDSAKFNSIRNKARKLYKPLDDSYFRNLKAGIIPGSVGGTEVEFYKKGGAITRMVVKTWTETGLLATEYYLDSKKLIFVYMTMEYFSDAPKTDSWTNFKGLGGWEARLYFSEEKLFHRKDTGTVPPASAANFAKLPSEAAKLIEQIKKH